MLKSGMLVLCRVQLQMFHTCMYPYEVRTYHVYSLRTRFCTYLYIQLCFAFFHMNMSVTSFLLWVSFLFDTWHPHICEQGNAPLALQFLEGFSSATVLAMHCSWLRTFEQCLARPRPSLITSWERTNRVNGSNTLRIVVHGSSWWFHISLL